MRAEIISIGTELLLGTITDTNASYLAQRLAGLGIDCYYVSQVGDNLPRIAEVLARAWSRSDLVVTTGGLGPTQDDLTREAIASMLGEEMSIDPVLERHLLSLFSRRGMVMPASNVKQAALIPSATAISNPVGSAPGWWVSSGGAPGGTGRIIVSMPGVPYEMKRMWEREAEPKLQSLSQSVIVSRTLKVLGIGESRVEEMVSDLMSGANPTLAPYAKNDGVHLRITAKCSTRAEAERLIASLEEKVRERLGDAIYGIDNETPQGVVGDIFSELGLSFALLEVGAGGIGSLGPLLGAHALCQGVIGERSLRVGSATRQTSDSPNLASIAERVRRDLNAEAVLAISVQQETIGDGGGSVKFSAEIIFETAGIEAGEREATYSWRATALEVNRLVGLAALNHARRKLKALVREKGMGVLQ